MPRNGSGVYSAPASTWNPAVAATTIDPTDWAALLADLVAAMSASVASDGQTTCSARIPFAAGVSVTAGGVAFPATQSAQADPNTLDDYEEGVWTPSIGGTATYTSRVGTYTKVGRLVTIFCDITINVIGTGSATTLSGLPFTSNATVAAALYLGYFSSIATAVVWLGAYIDVNATSVNFTDLTVAAVSANTVPTIFQNGTRIIISGSYYV